MYIFLRIKTMRYFFNDEKLQKIVFNINFLNKKKYYVFICLVYRAIGMNRTS